MGGRAGQEPSAREFAAGVVDALKPLVDRLRAGTADGGQLIAPLERLVADLNAYAGRQVLVPCTVRPAELLSAFSREVQPLLDQRLTLQVREDGKCPACRADPEALQDALLCLVANARDAMSSGGTIALTARRSRLDDGGPATEFAVRDHGTGMAPEVLAAAMHPFGAATPVPPGRAGLAVAEGFVHQSGGCLRIQTAADGTTVSLLLPCAKDEEAGNFV